MTGTTSSTDTDDMLAEALGRLLTQRCTPAAVQEAERSGWSADLWQAVADMGVPWIGIDEGVGGAGGSLATALRALRTCGRFACPLPIAETGLMAGWVLTSAGLDLPDGPNTVVPDVRAEDLRLDGDHLRGVAERVPWAGRADEVIAVCPAAVVGIPARAFRSEPFRNLAGEPRETIVVDGPVRIVSTDVDRYRDEFGLRGALCRAALMVGALERVSEMTVEYANARVQFTRPISSFQAVGSHLVRMTSEAQLAAMALDSVVPRVDDADDLSPLTFEIACLKAIAGRAATTVTAAAHQVHGAIGMTQEYSLQLFTRRLWSWREEFGSTGAWERCASRAVLDHGHETLWELVAI